MTRTSGFGVCATCGPTVVTSMGKCLECVNCGSRDTWPKRVGPSTLSGPVGISPFYHPRTPEDPRWLALYEIGAPDRVIGRLCGNSYFVINTWRRRHKLPPGTKGHGRERWEDKHAEEVARVMEDLP